MLSRDRLLTTLDHREPDRVPFDLGSTQVTGIHARVYSRLRQALDLPSITLHYCDYIQQLALPDSDVVERLGVDLRGLFPLNSHNWNVAEQDTGDYYLYIDEWGITHRRPKPEGLYYSLWQAPLDRPDLTVQDIRNHPWPNFCDPQRVAGLRKEAENYRSAGYAVVLKDPFAGVFEMSQRIVGMERLLSLMVIDPSLAASLFDKMVELKLDFWETALPHLADVVDVISQTDDFGSQVSQIISPRMFRQQLKPCWQAILHRQRQLAPHTKCFFHSCGNVRPLIPDFIEMGVDILNPVHTHAHGMEPVALKHDFGDSIVFWGGGVDTQEILPSGTPQSVQDEVRRNIEALAPGGGFVFAAVHNIQSDVPVENILAMYHALLTFGRY